MAKPDYRAVAVTGKYETPDGKTKDRTIPSGAGWEGANGQCINVELEAMPVMVNGKFRITLWKDDGQGPRGREPGSDDGIF
jgi:hypothetical protein